MQVVDIVKNYNSLNYLKYSDWIDTISLNNYYYFVENLGYCDVEVFIEISPDGNIVFQDSGPFIIKVNELSYIQPMRVGRFTRIVYKNLFSSSANLISVWLQGRT